MDIQGIIESVTEHLKEAPEKIKDFFQDPGSHIESITGEKLDPSAIADVAKGVFSKIKEEGGDAAGKLEEVAGDIPGAIGGLGEKIEESPIGEAVSAIGEKIGSLFGKKDSE